MAQTPPPTITPAPTPAPQRGDRATFSARVDAFVLWLTAAVAQFAAVASNVYANALDAFASATAALGYRDTALTYRDAAQAARDTAQGYRDTALTYRNEAQAARDAAQNYALALTATSTTSLTVGAGAKTFATQAGKQFTVGQVLYFVNPADATQWMAGPVTAYSGTSLSANITDVSSTASGQTVANWNISISGLRGAAGPTGGVTGGNLTGALNEVAATSIPSAAALDIWSPAGNFVPVTGTATVTSFTTAPQAGADRTLLAAGAFTLTASANLVIKGVQSGSSITLAAGDEIDVRAETPTKFRVTVRRGDGTAMSALYGAFQNTLRIRSMGTFVARRTGWHRITVVGSGGRGGIAIISGGGLSGKATGGGAGGMAVGMRFLVAGVTYTVSPGARLTSATQGSGPSAVAGAAGNASSFSGPNILTITANGGGAGQASNVSGATVAGAVGGTASGGDYNMQGGGSGSITALVDGSAAATGGGAVGIQGSPGYSSGDISVTGYTSASGAYYFATGGAGTGGNSPGITVAGLPATSSILTGGGGSGGPGSTTAGGPNWDGVAQGPAAPVEQGMYVVWNQTGGGGPAGATGGGAGGTATNGGGGGASYAGNSGTVNYSCGGSGGAAGGSNIASGAVNDMPGGGSGGIASTAGPLTAGQPGGGLVQIEW